MTGCRSCFFFLYQIPSINSLPAHTAILIQTKRMSSRQVIARGQTTIYIQKDSYTISQSLGEYVFPADHSGKVLSAVSLTSTVKVTCGDSEYKDFTMERLSSQPVSRPFRWITAGKQ